MDFASFMSKMLKPTYVWRMASGLVGMRGEGGSEPGTPLVRSARTRMRNAQRQIDDLVLARAHAIADERRCAAVSRSDNPARCEFHRGHDKVGPGIADSRVSHVTARRDWDHGAPKAGAWWMDEKVTS